jgi:hypothetical protein
VDAVVTLTKASGTRLLFDTRCYAARDSSHLPIFKQNPGTGSALHEPQPSHVETGVCLVAGTALALLRRGRE